MASPLIGIPLISQDGTKAPADALSGKVVAIYFSAHWCPPCRGFTPALRQFYEAVKSAGDPIEIVFVSRDRSAEEFKSYFANDHGSWLAVDYDSPARDTLATTYDVKGIPSLLVVNSKGKVVCPEARNDVAGVKDPAGAKAAFAEWKKAAGDWRETAGTTLGGATGPSDAAAMRAARLAALERRAGGGVSSGGGGGESQPVPAIAPQPAPDVAPQPAVTPQPAVPDPHPPSPAPQPGSPVPDPGVTGATTAMTQPAVDDAAIAQLMSMGFPADRAREALMRADGDVDMAVAFMLD